MFKSRSPRASLFQDAGDIGVTTSIFRAIPLQDALLIAKEKGVTEQVTSTVAFDEEASAAIDEDSDIRQGRFDIFMNQVNNADARLTQALAKSTAASSVDATTASSGSASASDNGGAA